MTLNEFHTARRMFFATPHGMMIAAEGDQRSHYEWLVCVFGEQAHKHYQEWTRGYWLGERIVAYKGQDFEHWIDHVKFVEIIKVFQHLASDKGQVIKEVGIGVAKGSVNGPQPWEPKILEDIDDYFAKIAQKIESDKEKKANAAADPAPQGQP